MIAPGTSGAGNYGGGVVKAVYDGSSSRAGGCEDVRRGRRGRVRRGRGEGVEGEGGLRGVEETRNLLQQHSQLINLRQESTEYE